MYRYRIEALLGLVIKSPQLSSRFKHDTVQGLRFMAKTLFFLLSNVIKLKDKTMEIAR